MNLLLDSHTIVWFLEGDNRISKKAIEVADDFRNNCYASIVSLWELAIKYSLGKIDLATRPSKFHHILNDIGIKILQITQEDLNILETLPFHHKDPFDRLLIAQAISNNFTLVSKDSNFSFYEVALLW